MASSSSPSKSNGSSPGMAAPGAGAAGGNSSSPSNGSDPPSPPAVPVILDSIAELVARLQLSGDGPEFFFDAQVDLPPFLRDVNEHQLRAVVADPNFPAEATFWVKASSATAFLQALSATPDAARLPLHLYVMPSTPLRDARRFMDMVQGAEAQPVAITVVNPIDLTNKVKAFNCANSLLDDINATRQALEKKLLDLAAFAGPKLQHAVEMQAQYDNAKARYQALQLPQQMQPACEEHLSMLAAGGRHLVAREVASVLEGARVSMEVLAAYLNKRAAELQETLNQTTFMGTSPPAPGYDHY